MPLVESTCCMNCHKLLQRIVVLETKLFAGLPKQTEHTADGHHGPPQYTAGESCESSESKQFIPSQIKSNHFYCHITTAQVPW